MTASRNKLYMSGAKYHMSRTEIAIGGDLGYIEDEPHPSSLAICGLEDDLSELNLL